MKTILSDRAKNRLAGIAGILLGTVMLMVSGPVLGQTYQGSEFCQGCHEKNYRDWSASGHPYKLMKGEQAKYRPIPLPLGTTWDDVSYVIGGYKWKSRYMDKDGYIITVTEDEDGNPVNGKNQYNFLTGEWVDYNAGVEKKPYNCGSCHTTNWVANPNPEDLSGNQDGLPGIHGKFDIGGVHCEQCHGNGMTMQIDDSAEACGICHYREAAPGADVNVIPAGGGFIKHHEQYNESLAGPHSTVKCVTCHNPHKRGEFSIVRECNACHAGRVEDAHLASSMHDYSVTCKDCHMPYASKSANQLGDFEGDVQTHIFYINSDPDANMFTEDGNYVALDSEGKAAVTMDFACQRCHATATLDELSRFAKNIHGEDSSVSELEYIGANPGLSGHWWGGLDRNGEGFLIEISDTGGEPVLIVSMYTYSPTGEQVYLIASGLIIPGAMDVDVAVNITSGRNWGEDANPADFTTPFGTGTFTFPACDVGTFTLTPNAEYTGMGYTPVGYDLSRDLTTSKIACPTFIHNPN